MSRSSRKIYNGAVCHILQRGNNKNIIFKDDDDYANFLKLIKRYKKRYFFNIYNYCLMPNHVHLLIQIISKTDMPKIFQGIFQSFQFHHRKKYDYCGSLYQNRYKSILVENNSYLLECARYIERNPVRAEIVKQFSEYQWSSYNFYAYGKKNSIITPNPLFFDLARTTNKRRKMYMEYVTQPRPYEELLDKNMGKLV